MKSYLKKLIHKPQTSFLVVFFTGKFVFFQLCIFHSVSSTLNAFLNVDIATVCIVHFTALF